MEFEASLIYVRLFQKADTGLERWFRNKRVHCSCRAVPTTYVHTAKANFELALQLK